jgi:hypothetical protein
MNFITNFYDVKFEKKKKKTYSKLNYFYRIKYNSIYQYYL